MKNKLKYIVALAAAFAALVLTSCAQLGITAEIDADNNVSYTYEITITGMSEDDINYNETKSYLGKIMRYWSDEEGFDTSLESQDGTLRMTAVLEKQCDSRQEAFEELYKYMTNSVSPFESVEYEYSQNFYYEDYSLTSAVSFEGMVDDDIYSVYPTTVGDDIDEFLSSLTCTVTFSLPLNESDISDEVTQNVVIKNIPLEGESEISISGVINNNVNVRYENNLLSTKAHQEKTIIIFSAAGVLALAALIVIIILRRKAKKKELEKTPEPTDKKEK